MQILANPKESQSPLIWTSRPVGVTECFRRVCCIFCMFHGQSRSRERSESHERHALGATTRAQKLCTLKTQGISRHANVVVITQPHSHDDFVRCKYCITMTIDYDTCSQENIIKHPK